MPADHVGSSDPHRAPSYTLTGPDGRAHPSPTPGTYGGHRGGRVYGRLDCRSALRALADGGYVADRVFFADEATALAAGYRPCGVCLPEHHATWKSLREDRSDPAAVRAAYNATRRLQTRLGPFDQLGSVVVGHSRDKSVRDAARLLCDHLASRGVEVRDVVDWPDQAASWLRHATRFTASAPDLWVVLISTDNDDDCDDHSDDPGGDHGWMRMRQRLRDTDWEPDRTIVIDI